MIVSTAFSSPYSHAATAEVKGDDEIEGRSRSPCSEYGFRVSSVTTSGAFFVFLLRSVRTSYVVFVTGRLSFSNFNCNLSTSRLPWWLVWRPGRAHQRLLKKRLMAAKARLPFPSHLTP